jgi:hydroxymethylpyrimidine/phosphomethylpyrimidine kinase
VLDPSLIVETLNEIIADLEVAAVHIGMLGNSAVAQAVTDFLRRSMLPHTVLDPVLRSSSGAALLDRGGEKLILEELMQLAEVITPNLEEASALSSLPVTNIEQMRTAAARLHTLGAENVVITGGHLEKAVDLLSFATSRGFEQEIFKADRQKSNSTHGTGCAFATALACHLAHGRGLPEAVLLAKAYVAAAITNAQPIGKGIGPVHHLYRMNQERRARKLPPERESAGSRN